METQNKKCSSNRHPEIDAVFYCQDCKKYFCNKCQNMHSDILEDHNAINLNKINEVFIDKCKEENHINKLEFFCKEHNILCCVACTSKIKNEGIYGQHHDCNVYHIKDIKDEKRNKLKENINNLEELYKHIEKIIEESERIFEEINKNKEELKMKVQLIFTKIRNVLNEKEDKLLNDIEEEYNKIYFKENLIKESEKLPNKIKKSIEKGKIIDKEWNENNLCSLINECINIENNIKEINIINDNIKKYNLNKDKKIIYNTEEEDIKNMINNIQNFGKIITDKYDDYKIEIKNPIHKLTNHILYILCLYVLNDGRLVSGSADKSIIIYNKTTYHPDIIIKEHNGDITCITQLSSGILASCSGDYTIKLFNIKDMKYEIFKH